MSCSFLSPDDPALVACMVQLHLSSDFPSINVLIHNPEGDAVHSFHSQVRTLHNDLSCFASHAAPRSS
ncbi:hypothetical protein JVU11DRAFT_9267 [Chiua virens]|nr:hypothetical protein JVU11DRAFT_9260 [Chiua virens]KAG9310678.1 hypothetical protein JVU11DRAFT_9267 [Chiua virens]